MITRNILIAGVAAAAIIAAGCSRAADKAENKPASEVRNVAITKVTKSSIEDYYEATGTVKAKTTTQISANMMGRILSFPAAEGDVVKRGQLLVEIDSAESRAQLQKARCGA